MTSQAILIVGTGALACLFAARLAEAGQPVIMLGSWPEGLQALRQRGVRVTSPDGEERVYRVEAISEPAGCRGVRQALVLVKSWQTERAAQQVGACLAPDGLALSLQNGLGNREALARDLGEDRVAVGSTTTGATLLGPGWVRPAGEGVVTLGAHPRLGPLADRLARSGFVVETVADVDAIVWGKLAINAAVNPLTAILRVPNGELLERPSARALMAAAARETGAVAAAQGIRLSYPDPAAAAETTVRKTAANRSSMFQDVVRGAPTEIDAICGAIVRAGERWAVPTPVNRVLWSLVKAMGEKPAQAG
jgi:2-dehydropantoate 2-reductase